MEHLVGGMGVGVALFLLVLAILWVILPFVVFGIAGKLDRMAFQQRQTNALLRHLCEKQTGSVPPIKY